MRPGICMECNKEFYRTTESHTVVDCINGLKEERDHYKRALELIAIDLFEHSQRTSEGATRIAQKTLTRFKKDSI